MQSQYHQSELPASDAIAQALQRIGEAAGISRMLLMQERREPNSGRLQHQVIQEWTAPTIPRQMDDPITRVIDNDEYGTLVEAFTGVLMQLEASKRKITTHQFDAAQDYAAQLDLDIPQFLREMAAGIHGARVQADIESGYQCGVTETPAFFIGVRHQEMQHLEAMLILILHCTVTPIGGSELV